MDNCFKTAKPVESALAFDQAYHQRLMVPAKNNSQEISRRNKQAQLSSSRTIS
jgi:hypothetical protein